MNQANTPADTSTSSAHAEAADWFVRLGDVRVSAATLDEFQAWRRRPGNAEAYQTVEQAWHASQALGDDPDIQAAVHKAYGRNERDWRRPMRLIPLAGGVAALAALAVFIAVNPSGDAYSTAPGELRTVTLEDGSMIRLDSDSVVRARFSGAERRIVLERGQALFNVEADVTRPFHVVAGDTRVSALGTRFTVRIEGEGVRVLLAEGVVEVQASGPATSAPEASHWRLRPGEQIMTGQTSAAPQSVDVDRAMSWTEGRLAFERTPLADAIAEINRYADKPIQLSAPHLAGAPVSGVFRTGDTEAFLAATALMFGLERRDTATAIRLTATPSEENSQARSG